ncbi:MAG TPA: hypothetical protein VMZ06_06900, partial [Candidatus Bathyarchaeia archaeon]|nr:hypothetical protein [Candidatus Bathyarchaeia archaeon]
VDAMSFAASLTKQTTPQTAETAANMKLALIFGMYTPLTGQLTGTIGDNWDNWWTIGGTIGDSNHFLHFLLSG